MAYFFAPVSSYKFSLCCINILSFSSLCPLGTTNHFFPVLRNPFVQIFREDDLIFQFELSNSSFQKFQFHNYSLIADEFF